jgi:hypothetical protein
VCHVYWMNHAVVQCFFFSFYVSPKCLLKRVHVLFLPFKSSSIDHAHISLTCTFTKFVRIVIPPSQSVSDHSFSLIRCRLVWQVCADATNCNAYLLQTPCPFSGMKLEVACSSLWVGCSFVLHILLASLEGSFLSWFRRRTRQKGGWPKPHWLSSRWFPSDSKVRNNELKGFSIDYMLETVKKGSSDASTLYLHHIVSNNIVEVGPTFAKQIIDSVL